MNKDDHIDVLAASGDCTETLTSGVDFQNGASY